MILDNDHKKNGSPQLSPFMSFQLDPIQKWFWTMITGKKIFPSWIFQLNPLWKLFLALITRKKFLPSWVPLWIFNCLIQKLLFDTDHKKTFLPSWVPWWVSLQIDPNKKLFLTLIKRNKILPSLVPLWVFK